MEGTGICQGGLLTFYGFDPTNYTFLFLSYDHKIPFFAFVEFSFSW